MGKRDSEQFTGYRIKVLFFAYEMVYVMIVFLLLSDLQKGCRGGAFDFVKGAHLRTVFEGSVVVCIYGISTKGIFIGVPLLIEVQGVFIYIESSYGQVFLCRVVVSCPLFARRGGMPILPRCFPSTLR